MSKRDYRRKGAQRTGGDVGGCIAGFGYMLVVHPLRWVWSKLRGKPAPDYPDFIRKEMN